MAQDPTLTTLSDRTMSAIVAINQSPPLVYLQSLLEGSAWLLPISASESAVWDVCADFSSQHELSTHISIADAFQQACASTTPICLTTSETSTLVAARVAGTPPQILLSHQEGPPTVARRLVLNAIEAWQLKQELASSYHALDESAMQLAQSFEEQNWLRGFARNASSLSRVNSASDMADGILQPLGYLLRAQDVYLIVDPEEVGRSGLTDTKYGSSDFSIQCIRELLISLGVDRASGPFVKNNVLFETRDGNIDSLIAVAVGGAEHYLGHLVAINRGTGMETDNLPVYDPEFGSGDVGLLEEAAVLLSTQAHNIHLLVRSNQLFLDTLHAMSSAIDARDSYTQGHSERVARLSFDLAQLYGLSDEACQEIYLAGILHDVGKIGIPDSVLLKNGPLTDEEFKVIQQHPEIGYRIVQQLGHLQFVLPGVLYHHERWDGAGYPHGLRGHAIPVMARLMAVADAFDAMTSSRPYRSAMPVAKAHSIVNAGSGQQWEPQAVDCFNQWLASRHALSPTAIPSCQSIIPQDSPIEYLRQAVMTLGH